MTVPTPGTSVHRPVPRQEHPAYREDAPSPSVSVVIPCYNHAGYLSEAIESVLEQNYAPLEILVVDDGSTDDTRGVVARFPSVRYVWQENAGLAAARNTGIRHTEGELLLFLDADDWLFEGAIAAGVAELQRHPEAGCLTGRYVEVHTNRDFVTPPLGEPVGDEPYLDLLRRNRIEMHATVLYRREALLAVGAFDPKLRAVEDYELYLRLARHYPIHSYDRVVAAYRKHGHNMSDDAHLMLTTVLQVLRSQRQHVLNSREAMSAYMQGARHLKNYYGSAQVIQVKENWGVPGRRGRALYELLDLFRHAPVWFVKRSLGKFLREGYHRAKPYVPRPARTALAHVSGRRHATPPVGRVKIGDLRRTEPISGVFGFERGLPVDRRYIQEFLERHAEDVQGRVLEIGDRAYTTRYGGDRVTQSDVLHVWEGNPEATFVGDLTDAPHLPSDAFDCVILTQTLQLIYDVPAALETLHRILKPGGVLLVTVSSITKADEQIQGEAWYWSFTQHSLRRRLEDAFPNATIDVQYRGNVLTSVAFLHGLAAHELTDEEFAVHDPEFATLITGRVVKEGTSNDSDR